MTTKKVSNDKIKFQIRPLNDILVVALEGMIDEDVDFSPIANHKATHYIFDFEKIRMINSCGIREWVKFLNIIGDKNKITYKNCPQNVIEQMGMVHGFIRENAEVESFFAPYYCSKCDKTYQILINGNEVKNKMSPEKTCSKDKNTMEFDSIPEQYFSFIRK